MMSAIYGNNPENDEENSKEETNENELREEVEDTTGSNENDAPEEQSSAPAAIAVSTEGQM